MPIDFNPSDDGDDDVVSDKVINGDGSVCLQLSKPGGANTCVPLGIRPDGKYQLFTISAEDAAALGLDRDPATGFIRWVG